MLHPTDEPEVKKGAWVVYAYDMCAYPIAIFETELEAHRHSNELQYSYVRFWEFGTEWSRS